MLGLMSAILKMPSAWLLWIVLMVTVNLAVPLFYIQTLEAQLTIAAMLSGFVIQSYIHSRLGFVRLLGLAHIFWLPLVIWIGFRVSNIGLGDYFSIWLTSLVLVNSISLIIDSIDVIRFFLGERSPTMQG